VYAGKPTTNVQYGMRTCSTPVICTYNTTVIAIINSFGSYDDSGSGSLLSGAQKFSLYALPQVHTYSSDAQTVVLIDCSASSNPSCTPFTPINSAEICYASGSTDQSGLITIGNANSGGLSVELQIFDERQCGFPSS
jgi:hypothetical protein